MWLNLPVGPVTLGVMSTVLSRGLDRVARPQHGVFTRTQALRDGGMALDAVKSRVRRGTWRRIYSGVYTDVLGTLERPAQLWAAVLYAGRGAVISHETAAELHELTDDESPLVHVAIPAGRQVAPAAGLRVHRLSRVYEPQDGHRDPPHTTIEDTLLDLAQVAATFDEACGWITRAFGRELTSEVRLQHAMSQRVKVRWRAELTDVIGCGQAGDHSALEYRFTKDVERAHGLPVAERQVPFTLANGQSGRRDRVYPGYGVAIELDGRLAHRPEDKWRELARDRAAIVSGLEPLRYGWSDVNDTPCATAAEVGAILKAGGWQGSPRLCSPSCAAAADAKL